jgi:acyl-CoA thioester hydrolase
MSSVWPSQPCHPDEKIREDAIMGALYLLLDDLAVEIPISVRYSETDMMGVVYHANYLIWFDIARVELLRRLGIEVKKMQTRGFLMPVVEATCRYLSPARFGDEISLKAIPERSTVARLTVHYEVMKRGSRSLLAKGRTVSVLTTTKGKLILRVPDELGQALEHLIR